LEALRRAAPALACSIDFPNLNSYVNADTFHPILSGFTPVLNTLLVLKLLG
jgi:hypothetical protein